VTMVSRLDLSTFPDSPYAAELQRDSAKLCFFQPQLEAEFLRSRLMSSRTLIRVACVCAAALTTARGVEQLYAKTGDLRLLIEFVLVIASSIVLAWIAWSPGFERLYPRWAPILVPLRNSIVAIQVAAAAARGESELLMALPITLMGALFFLGLSCRAALVCCGLTVATYAIAATWLHLPQAIALHSFVLLAGGGAACMIALLHLEKISRKSFLEERLIAELAQRDPLTGTKNRRVFDEHLELLWQQAIVNERALALLLIDIDHFKAYNDRYGHQAGDRCLREVAAAVKHAAPRRPLDLVARYGGEEIIAVLIGADRAHAEAVAEGLREAVANLRISHLASPTRPYVTVSVGVATLQPGAEYSHDLAVQFADRALYAAKAGGRDGWASMAGLREGRGEDIHRTGSHSDEGGRNSNPDGDELLKTAT
jgi:diguanylate cyclase (GGDEF)-like protein